jgi:HlyD family secretion protein
MVADQQAGFEAARRKYRAELAIFGQQIAALEAVIEGHENQRLETLRQIDLALEQRESLEALLGEGLTRKSEVLALKRTEAELRGKVGQLAASAAEARKSVAEIRERIERTKTQRIEDAAARLLDARLRRADLVEQLKSAGDVTRRLVVTAPASGVVMQLSKFNPGAIVGPGQEIMMIVPQNTAMQVEAVIEPQDVESVWVGQDAWLRFPAQHANGAPPVEARVVYLSPDRVEDQKTGHAYYLARLEILSVTTDLLDPAAIGPGQAAEVYIATGERTFADYLLEPFMRTFRRSVRES